MIVQMSVVASFLCRCLRGLALAGLLFMAGIASAATVGNLYSAEVERPPGTDLNDAFHLALEQVLIKVTGRSAPLTAETRAEFGNSAALVQQYRNTGDGKIEVGFDPVALRRLLDSAGLPVWEAERPAVLVWLAMDTGRGQREILPAAETGADTTLPGFPPPGASTQFDPVRQQLLDTGGQRGLPLILPLVDSVDLETVTFSDLWGDFSEPVIAASARYRPDAILIGRVRGADPATGRVRWTLLTGDERLDWVGSLAAGPDGAADRLAERLAATAGSASIISVQVSGVETLQDYGAVFNYLDGLGIVETCSVDRVEADRVWFGLRVRGDADRLMRSIALSRLLSLTEFPDDPQSAQLHYVLVDG